MSREAEKRNAEEATERIGNFEFTARLAEPTPEGRARWATRANALTAWLLAEWRRETAGEAA